MSPARLLSLLCRALTSAGKAGRVGDEVRDRLRRLGECQIEVIDGRLFFDEFQRRMLLGMLLENVGMDAAIELADLNL